MHAHTPRKYVYDCICYIYPFVSRATCQLVSFFVCVFRRHLDMHHGGQMAVAR